MSRKAISLKTKLAAALLTIKRANDDGQLEYIIPHEHAQKMSDEQIISLFQWDHYPIRKEAGGTDEAHNLQPLTIAEHRYKTANFDQPQIAKIKRIQDWKQEREPSRMQGRGFQKRKPQRSASRPIERPRYT